MPYATTTGFGVERVSHRRGALAGVPVVARVMRSANEVDQFVASGVAGIADAQQRLADACIGLLNGIVGMDQQGLAKVRIHVAHGRFGNLARSAAQRHVGAVRRSGPEAA